MRGHFERGRCEKPSKTKIPKHRSRQTRSRTRSQDGRTIGVPLKLLPRSAQPAGGESASNGGVPKAGHPKAGSGPSSFPHQRVGPPDMKPCCCLSICRSVEAVWIKELCTMHLNLNLNLAPNLNLNLNLALNLNLNLNPTCIRFPP